MRTREPIQASRAMGSLFPLSRRTIMALAGESPKLYRPYITCMGSLLRTVGEWAFLLHAQAVESTWLSILRQERRTTPRFRSTRNSSLSFLPLLSDDMVDDPRLRGPGVLRSNSDL